MEIIIQIIKSKSKDYWYNRYMGKKYKVIKNLYAYDCHPYNKEISCYIELEDAIKVNCNNCKKNAIFDGFYNICSGNKICNFDNYYKDWIHHKEVNDIDNNIIKINKSINIINRFLEDKKYFKLLEKNINKWYKNINKGN